MIIILVFEIFDEKDLWLIWPCHTYAWNASGAIFALPIKMRGFKIKEECFAPFNLCHNRNNIDP